jgi:hypothetical protein
MIPIIQGSESTPALCDRSGLSGNVGMQLVGSNLNLITLQKILPDFEIRQTFEPFTFWRRKLSFVPVDDG